MASNDQPKKNDASRQGDARNLDSLGMDELLSLGYDKSTITEGEIVTGRVLKVTPSDVVVDVGYKSEGLLPVVEVTGYDGQVRVKRGDDIEVFIERLEDPSGYVILSREKAARMRVWDDIEAAFKAEQPISGRVIDRVKGGLSVDVGGVKAFLPGSLVDTKPIKNLDSLRGHEYKFKIVSFDKKRSNVVLSRRAIVEVEHAEQKQITFGRLEEGKLTHGVVKNITDYGVFVDLGGIDGLLHITDISWGRVNHPTEYFNLGDEIEVIVLKFDPANERVSLGYKQKSPDPWSDVAVRYPLGTKVHGRVVSLTDYGAFVELEEGVEGLIHVSEMSWTKKIRNPSKLLSIGTEVEAVVAAVPVLDSLRSETSTNGVYNITEFGTVSDPEHFAALMAYSPYHHVADQTSYPAVLLTAGEHDTRVDAWHAKKMTARLQEATRSEHPILLRMEAGGHLEGSLDQTIEESTDIYSFLFDQLDLGYRAPGAGR